MMKYFFTSLIALLLIACGSEPQRKSVSTLSTFMDSTSYSLGADLGENLKRQQVEIDYDVFMAGLMDGMETEMVKLDQGRGEQLWLHCKRAFEKNPKKRVKQI